MPYPPAPTITLPDPWHVDDDLVLRLPIDSDVDAILEACQDPTIQTFTRVPVPYVKADAAGYVQMCRSGLADSSMVGTLILDRGSGALLGSIGLFIDWRDAVAEIGYWLAPEGRGRGVATRAGRPLCDLGFSLGLGRIHLQAAIDNPASMRVAERLGFTKEGVLRSAGIGGPAGDLTAPRVDMAVYGLLSTERAR